MDKTGKFLLPSPKFKKIDSNPTSTPHFLSPQGMLLPKEKQPPPMFGPRGTTVPPKFLSPQTSPSSSSQFERTKKYFCEPCEAEFHTSTDYKVHRSEHTECEINNCSFRGHPSFMDTHIGQQHSLGLYEQLKKLSTPEEIAQWRSDRIKNYPTVASVAQKWKARQQRMLRGEKLERNKNRFGRSGDRRSIRGDKQKDIANTLDSAKKRRKKNKIGRQDTRNVVKNLEAMKKPTEEEHENLICGTLRMFKGTGGMAGYAKMKKVETHALSALLGMYGADSEDESENEAEKKETALNFGEVSSEDNVGDPCSGIDKNGTEEQPTKVVPLEAIHQRSVNNDENSDLTSYAKSSEDPFKYFQIEINQTHLKPKEPQSSDDEAPDEAPIAKTSNIPDKPQLGPPLKKFKHEQSKRKTPKSGLDYRKLRGGRQNTMLEKLLEPDIRHERNVLLQCVRFVIENNFFDIGSASVQSHS